MKIYIEDEYGIRIDQYLADYFEDISRSKISNLIKKGDILVNGNIIKSSYKINQDDEIFVDLSSLKIEPLKPEELSIEIIYQDEYIAVISKPMGIISHPTNKIRSNTVVNFLLHKFDKLSYLNGEDRPGIVHRLDKDTSGLMIVALDDQAMIKLKSMFQDRSIIKKYRSIVNHPFTIKDDSIEEPIGRNIYNRKLMAVTKDGKYAKTSFEVLEQNQEYAYLDIELHTGRTHQIRVHMSYINHPILGDKDYNNIKLKFNIEAQLLQAYYLKFNHPITNQELEFKIPMYPEFNKYYDIIFREE